MRSPRLMLPLIGHPLGEAATARARNRCLQAIERCAAGRVANARRAHQQQADKRQRHGWFPRLLGLLVVEACPCPLPRIHRRRIGRKACGAAKDGDSVLANAGRKIRPMRLVLPATRRTDPLARPKVRRALVIRQRAIPANTASATLTDETCGRGTRIHRRASKTAGSYSTYIRRFWEGGS